MTTMRAHRALWVLAGVLLLAEAGSAHFANQSYIFLRVYHDGMEGRIELPAGDLDGVLSIDTDGDGALSEAEVSAAGARIEAYLDAHFSIAAEERRYDIRYVERAVRRIEIGDYVVQVFQAESTGLIPDVVTMRYSAILEAKPDHRGGLVIEHNAKIGLEKNHVRMSFLFGPGREEFDLRLLGENRLRQLARFVREGMWHIWRGFDHVLFLIALILPAVMVRRGHVWEPVDRFRPAVIHVVKVVTVFTVAHSITLSLAAFNVLELPTRLVESVIALSVLLVALNNLYPIFSDRTWLIVFAFGLFHGFGFASVLREIALNRQAKILSLFGFNIGVEIGQVILILAVFPVLYLLRRQTAYRPVGLTAASALISVAATWWFVSRTFDVGSG